MFQIGRDPKWRLALGCAMIFLAIAGCKKTSKDDTGPKGPVTNSEVNNWVITQMRDVYYWNTSILANSNLNFNQEPLAFFDRLLHQDDRFSWMQNADELVNDLSGISTTVGMGIELIRMSSQSDRVVIAVRYALKNAPAYNAGIRRGDFITQINGRNLTLTNYREVMEPYYGNSAYQVEVSRLQSDSLSPVAVATLQPIENFQEQAIHLDTVFQLPSGKKIAYLFYNKFLNNQINPLIAAFARFKQVGASELILDLRYNPGGGIAVSGALAGLVQKDFTGDEVFVRYQYNSNYREEVDTYKDLFGGKSDNAANRQNAVDVVNAIKSANLNLSRVFVLATENSASASELVINNLRPYLGNQGVIHIGAKTVGKNEGSITIVDERKPRRIDWGIQPIVVKLANSAGFGNYPNGLQPQHEVDEWSVLPFYPIGSKEDPLVAKALTLIDPSLQAVLGLQMSTRQSTARRLAIQQMDYQDRRLHPVRPVQLDRMPGKPDLR